MKSRARLNCLRPIKRSDVSRICEGIRATSDAVSAIKRSDGRPELAILFAGVDSRVPANLIGCIYRLRPVRVVTSPWIAKFPVRTFNARQPRLRLPLIVALDLWKSPEMLSLRADRLPAKIPNFNRLRCGPKRITPNVQKQIHTWTKRITAGRVKA